MIGSKTWAPRVSRAMTSVSLSAASADESSPATRRPLSARASRLHVRIFFSLVYRRASPGQRQGRPLAGRRLGSRSARWYPACRERFLALRGTWRRHLEEVHGEISYGRHPDDRLFASDLRSRQLWTSPRPSPGREE